MTRHEDVYYTCNGCGNRLGEEWTEVRVTNTDSAAVQPNHDYDLCAACWLDVFAILDRQAIEKQRREREEHRHAYLGLNELRPWDDL